MWRTKEKTTHKAERKAVRITLVLVYAIGLDAGHWQFGNNFIQDEKNLRTTKIGRDRRLSPICQSEDFFLNSITSNWSRM